MPKSSTVRRLARELLDETESSQTSNEDLAVVYEASLDRIPGGLLIPIDHIEIWKGNPRSTYDDAYIASLAASIAENGLLQVPTVRRDPHRPGFYIISTGNCRLLALRRLHSSADPDRRSRFERVECKLKDQDEAEAFADALAENVARNDLTRKEFMAAVIRMHTQYGWSARTIARRIGRHHGDIAELLNVAQHPDLAEMVNNDVIKATTAGAILGLRPELQAEAIARVRGGRIKTVAQVAAFAEADEARRDLARWRESAIGGDGVTVPREPPRGPSTEVIVGQGKLPAEEGRRISDTSTTTDEQNERRISDTAAPAPMTDGTAAEPTPVRAHTRARRGQTLDTAAGREAGAAPETDSDGAARVRATREFVRHGLEYARQVAVLDPEELSMLKELHGVLGALIAAHSG